MAEDKTRTISLLTLYAEVKCSSYGLRPGVDPLEAAYETGRHDSIMEVLELLRDFDTLEEAVELLKSI